MTLAASESDASDYSEPVKSSDWAMPVLDGSTSQEQSAEEHAGISQTDLERFPGWDEAMIQSYLDQGWTMDQLAEYYAKQLE